MRIFKISVKFSNPDAALILTSKIENFQTLLSFSKILEIREWVWEFSCNELSFAHPAIFWELSIDTADER